MKDLNNAAPYSRRNRKRAKGSSTSGKIKSNTCKADWRKKFFAKSARSYKDPEYPAYLEMMKKQRADAKSSDTK